MIAATLNIVIILCIVLAGILAYTIVKKSIYDNYIKLSLQYSAQQQQKCQLYMKLIEETSTMVANNLNVDSGLKGYGNYESVAKVLDGVIKANTSIAALSLYTDSDAIYTSSSISNPPTLADLCKSETIRHFLSSSDTTLWLIRRDTMDGFYTTSRADRYAGVYTMIAKVYDPQNKLLGYLLIDTSVNAVFSFFHTDGNASIAVNSAYILANDESFIAAPYNKVLNKPVLGEIQQKMELQVPDSYFIRGKYLTIFQKLSASDDQIAIVYTLDAILGKLVFVKTFLAVFSLFFIGLCFFMIRLISSSISQPLTSLYRKMQEPLHRSIDS